MTFKTAVLLVVLLAATRTRAAVDEQAASKDSVSDQSASIRSASATGLSGASRPIEKTNYDEGSLNFPPPRITVAAPVQAPPGWPVPDRIAWVASLLLTVMGYVGIMLAVSILRKIERQTQSVEAAVDAAAAIAQSALLHAQAIVRAERPWVMVTAEPSPGIENSSTVVATNRGKSPARIIATTEGMAIAIDKAHLPDVPEYETAKTGVLPDPIILLPGESSSLRIFGWEDVKGLCTSGDSLKRVEDWDEKIFLYGKITMKISLLLPAGRPMKPRGVAGTSPGKGDAD
jgi:hypothetical protein